MPPSKGPRQPAPDSRTSKRSGAGGAAGDQDEAPEQRKTDREKTGAGETEGDPEATPVETEPVGIKADVARARSSFRKSMWWQFGLQSFMFVLAIAAFSYGLLRTPPAAPKQPASSPTERGDLLREFQGATEQLKKIQTNQSEVLKELAAVKSETAAAEARADETAKSLEALRAGVKSTQTELGNLAGAQARDVKETTGKIKAVGDAVKAASEVQKTALADAGKQTEAVAKDLEKTLATQKKETNERLDKTEAALARLRTTLAVPSDAELSQVLFLVDEGRRLAEYRFEDVRGVVADALDTAARQTPNRRVGLMGCPGEKKIDHLKLGKPYPADVETLRQNIETIKPNKGEDTRWRSALDAGLNQFAIGEGKKRVVYITSNPAEIVPLESGALAGKFRAAGVEVWIVQLVRPGETPAADLSALATETGGQFLTVFGGRDGDEKKKTLGTRRLAATVYSALDLRPPAP